jgi:hypothetical protein
MRLDGGQILLARIAHKVARLRDDRHVEPTGGLSDAEIAQLLSLLGRILQNVDRIDS